MFLLNEMPLTLHAVLHEQSDKSFGKKLSKNLQPVNNTKFASACSIHRLTTCTRLILYIK